MTSAEPALHAGPVPTAVGVRPWIAGGALLGALFVATVALPLAIYTTVLALFGAAHVGSELRYIDFRYGARLRGRLGLWLALPLAGAVAARCAGILHILAPVPAVTIELLLGAAMTALCIGCMRRNRWAALLASLALFSGAAIAPVPTLLFLAIAHNFTPVAFLADACHGARRRRVMAVAAIPFLILPLVIASGLPFRALAEAGLVAPEATLLQGGGLDSNLGAYVPARFINSDWALPVFSAAVFAQCMHYVVVILLLPRLIDPRNRAIVRWPPPGRFALYLAGAAVLLALGFSLDFKTARQVYGLLAMVHSWIEIPILVLALDRSHSHTSLSATRRNPNAVEAPLATRDPSSDLRTDSGTIMR